MPHSLFESTTVNATKHPHSRCERNENIIEQLNVPVRALDPAVGWKKPPERVLVHGCQRVWV